MAGKPYWGFGEFFDFSHKHSLKGKLKNILFAFVITFFWVVFLRMVALAIAMPVASMRTLLVKGVVWKPELAPTGELTASFVDSVLIAPFVETILFMWWLYRIVIEIERRSLMDPAPPRRIWLPLKIPVVIFSSIAFGVAHGSLEHVWLQGMYGLIWSWLYFKNNNSFWSVVVVHACWNFVIAFALPQMVRH